ncbi:MAG: metallophosphoesterase [Dehalococcoidia bacterium]|nr:metallophosphoesterase [Dehalococcoidia bacterium]
MRIALLADMHSNLEERRGLDQLWLLGYTAGYGPRPNECIALLRRYPQIAIAGNHDQTALGRLDTAWFNANAARAEEWTADVLDDVSREYLAGHPEILRQGLWTLVHGTLHNPVFEYLDSPTTAAAHLRAQLEAMRAVGHTYVPLFARPAEDAPVTFQRLEDGAVREIDERVRAVINLDGVGQPSDDDHRSAYALLDDADGVIIFHRIAYDIASTQRDMAEAGLPRPLSERLSVGR